LIAAEYADWEGPRYLEEEVLERETVDAAWV